MMPVITLVTPPHPFAELSSPVDQLEQILMKASSFEDPLSTDLINIALKELGNAQPLSSQKVCCMIGQFEMLLKNPLLPHRVLEDPVIDERGQVWERRFFEHYQTLSDISPFDEQPLTSIKTHTLAKDLISWIALHFQAAIVLSNDPKEALFLSLEIPKEKQIGIYRIAAKNHIFLKQVRQMRHRMDAFSLQFADQSKIHKQKLTKEVDDHKESLVVHEEFIQRSLLQVKEKLEQQKTELAKQLEEARAKYEERLKVCKDESQTNITSIKETHQAQISRLQAQLANCSQSVQFYQSQLQSLLTNNAAQSQKLAHLAAKLPCLQGEVDRLRRENNDRCVIL